MKEHVGISKPKKAHEQDWEFGMVSLATKLN